MGSTGLVGRHALTLLIESQRYSAVNAPIRRADLSRYPQHPKLHATQIDFLRMEAAAAASAVSPTSNVFACDVFFCALGTTIKQAGSQKAFYQVDHDFIVQSARLARQGGARTAVVISSVGADPKSRVFYSKVKGETERDLAALGFERLHLLRPSLLLGNRAEQRLGEKLASAMAEPLNPIFNFGPLAKYRPIQANRVATAMLEAASRDFPTGVHIHEGSDLEALSKPR